MHVKPIMENIPKVELNLLQWAGHVASGSSAGGRAVQGDGGAGGVAG